MMSKNGVHVRVLKILGLAIPIYILQRFLKIFHNSFFNRVGLCPQAPLKNAYDCSHVILHVSKTIFAGIENNYNVVVLI